MTRATCGVGAAILLAGATAIAFFSGGYFTEPRLIAAIAAWALVVLAAVAAPIPLPRSVPARLALGGLALLAAVVGASIARAPLKGPALDDFERLLLYVATFTAAVAFLRGRWALRALEPALAAGALIVVCEGLSERLLPGLFTLAHSVSAGGRLEQPLTYWNAMGALAAIGLVLAVRVAGDSRRDPLLRAPLAAAAPGLALALYLTFSRGALAAAAAGLVALAALGGTKPQLRSLALAVGASIAPVAAVAGLSHVRTLGGSLGSREREGAVLLAVLLVAAGAAAAVQWLLAGRERDGRLSAERVRPGSGRAVAAVGVVAIVAVALVAAGYHERQTGPTPAFGATSRRLGSLESDRYAYWKVAFRTFAHHPLIGDGSASFQVDWLAHRTIPDPTHDAHSIYIETASELGLVGLAALALFLGGTIACAARLWRLDAQLAAGPAAGMVVWLVHAGLDWDWEMPAVSLVALVLMGALVAASDSPPALNRPPPRPAGEAAPVPAQS